MRTPTLILVCALASACVVGPKHKMPDISVPDAFRGDQKAAATSLADQSWWGILHDDELRSLIDEAIRSGYDVQLAAWRVEEARANAGIAGSELYPQLSASAGYSNSQPSQYEFGAPIPVLKNYDVRVNASWEIDLWGRVRHLREAALAQYLATDAARRGVQLTLVSEVASAYFELRALDLQLEIAQRTAEAFKKTHDLFNRRLEAGLASSLETASAAASLATTNSTIPDFERQIAEKENLICFLVGRNPGEIHRGAALVDQLLPPDVPAGLPSDLLRRRPDLAEAEQQLVAANAEVGVTVADYFPRISLTGFFGGVGPQVSGLFDTGKTWSIGAGLVTPIFQGGRLKNQHRAAVARWEQARVHYEQSVSNAFSEVSTALVAYQKLAGVEKEQADAVENYRDAVDRSNSRYLSGLSNYLEVLQAQRQLFPAENALARTRFDRLSTLVQLYRALGGGWLEPQHAS